MSLRNANIWSDPSAQLGVFRHCTTQKQKKWILKIAFLRNANSWIKYEVNIDKNKNKEISLNAF